jgi:hypothetical protein
VAEDIAEQISSEDGTAGTEEHGLRHRPEITTPTSFGPRVPAAGGPVLVERPLRLAIVLGRRPRCT